MRKLLLGSAILMLLTTTAFADSILSMNTRPVAVTGDLSLVQGALDTIYGVNLVNASTGQRPNGVWGLQGGVGEGFNPRLRFEYAGDAGSNIFGIWSGYDTNGPINVAQIFSGPMAPLTVADVSWISADPNLVTITVGGSTTTVAGINRSWFGFYIEKENGTRYYTADQLNGDAPQALAYLNPANGRWVLAFEDTPYGQGDKDFNDMIVSIESITPVPDGGTTLVLLGGALLGLEALRRKLRF